jgi:small GTP-binding protein
MPIPTYKIVVVGPAGVGKSWFLSRLIDGSVTPDRPSTVGVEFFCYRCEVDQQTVKLQIWDTAGQERFRSVSKAYLRNALGAILMFDLADHRSFLQLDAWLNDIQLVSHPHCVILLVGNKRDLPSRQVSEEELLDFADQHRLDFLEASALLGENVTEAFLRVAHDICTKVANGKISLADGPVVLVDAGAKKTGCPC